MSNAAILRRTFTWGMIAVWLLICYSRIYLACHFPADLLLGSAVGLAAGGFCAWIYGRLCKRIPHVKE